MTIFHFTDTVIPCDLDIWDLTAKSGLSSKYIFLLKAFANLGHRAEIFDSSTLSLFWTFPPRPFLPHLTPTSVPTHTPGTPMFRLPENWTFTAEILIRSLSSSSSSSTSRSCYALVARSLWLNVLISCPAEFPSADTSSFSRVPARRPCGSPVALSRLANRRY